MVTEKQSDHNLLIRLDQKISDLQVSVKELSNNTIQRISELETDKAERKDVEVLQRKINDDIERRVIFLENWMSQRKEWGLNQTFLIKVLIAIGILIVGILVWHLTGYKI